MHIINTSGRLILTSITALLLTACGGGGGSGSDSTANSPTSSINTNLRTAANSVYMAFYQLDEVVGNDVVQEAVDLTDLNSFGHSTLSYAFSNWGTDVPETSCPAGGTYSISFSNDGGAMTARFFNCKDDDAPGYEKNRIDDGILTITKIPSTSGPDTHSVTFDMIATYDRDRDPIASFTTTAKGTFSFFHDNQTDPQHSRYTLEIPELHQTIVKTHSADDSTYQLDIKNYIGNYDGFNPDNSSSTKSYTFSGDLRIQDEYIPEPHTDSYFHISTDNSALVGYWPQSGTIYITGDDGSSATIEFDPTRANLYLDSRLEAEFYEWHAIEMWAHTPAGED